MRTPNWYEFVLLALAAFRVYRLIAEDTILDQPRRWVTRLGKQWAQDGDPVPSGYRARLGEFLTCPWCMGFWISVAWWGAYLLWPHAAVFAAVPWAISAIVALVKTNLDPAE